MPQREKLQYVLVFCTDLFSLLAAVLATWLLFGHRYHLIPQAAMDQVYQYALITALAFLVSFFCFSQNQDITRRTWQAELRHVTKLNLMLAAVMAVLLIVTKAEMLDSRYLYMGILLFNQGFLLLSHRALKSYLIKRFYKGGLASLVGVVTVAARAPALLRALKADWSKNLVGVALLDATGREQPIEGIPVAADFGSFLDWIRREPLDEVYFNIPYDSGISALPYVEEMESMGLTIHLNIPVLERFLPQSSGGGLRAHLNGQIEQAAGVPYATLCTIQRTVAEQVVKRIMDLAGALVGCLIAIPIIALVAIPLKLESRGPLIFKQKRVGLNGRVFHIYKLRSMYQDAEQRKQELMAQNEMNGLMFKVENDPRITRVGRFIRRTSIDELPQFFNVLKGEMSLVGTRPPTLDEYERYQSHHKRRLSMKPGITGMWQVSGRSDIEDFEQVVRLDVEYIDNWSVWLDIKILFKTLAVVLRREGAK